MNRRAFLASAAALAAAPLLAGAQATASGLVDRRTLFAHAYQMHDVDQLLAAPRERIDLNVMLRDGRGYVKLGQGDFECPPVYFRSGDVVEGAGIHTRLWFTQRAMQPADETRPTEYVQLRDLDLCVADRGDAAQHALWLPACREWTVDRVRTINFGGTSLYFYGKRTLAGDLAPSDTTRCVARQFASWGCRYGVIFGGTPGSPVSKGGTSNMNRLERPLVYWSEFDAYALMQGAGNVLEQPIAGNTGRDGIRVAWYGNNVSDAILERCGAFGVRKIRRKWSDKTKVTYHSGGNHGLGDRNY